MKKLEMTQMEVVYGGEVGPTTNQTFCFLFSTAYGLLCPPLGIAVGFVCLWS